MSRAVDEYQLFLIERDDLAERLNELISQGWELVTITLRLQHGRDFNETYEIDLADQADRNDSEAIMPLLRDDTENVRSANL